MAENAPQVVTRFAPSPTGFLHIGGARTALFNWLFARSTGGTFLLRIEDTDRARSTQEAIDAILDGMNWLGLDHDGEVYYQSGHADRHREVAEKLLADGHAYHCYASPEELDEMRAAARAEGRPMRYDGRWRDRDASEAPEGIAPVVRLKAPKDGTTTIADEVQGSVTVSNDQLDDLILLRADGTPTYMLSVVVDDHDMGVTHIVRGDDHLTNAFRQSAIYDALGWTPPVFAHIPLIHGADGAKLSKRHGALGVEAYRDMGYLPEAMRNYLLRLGWGHGDTEIISTQDALEVFSLGGIGKSAARFDMEKLNAVNAHYMREKNPEKLAEDVLPFIARIMERELNAEETDLLAKALPSLTKRAKTLIEVATAAVVYFVPVPAAMDEKAKAALSDAPEGLLSEIKAALEASEWTEEALWDAVKGLAESKDMKPGHVAPVLRAALTGQSQTPSIFEMMALWGPDETFSRINAQIAEKA